MSLEVFTGNIADLVPTNPAGTDPKSQGDDHIRGIKFTLLETFGPVVGKFKGGQMLGDADVKAIFYNSQIIAENLTLPTGQNGLSGGPITISPGFEVTLEPGAEWSIT